MTTNLHPQPQANFRQPDPLPESYGTQPAINALPTYDEVTPGEPPEFVVPAQYRRPFGAVPRDKRGKFWTAAFASAMSAAASFVVLFTPFALYGINVVAAIVAIVLGIRALVIVSKSPQTSYSGKAKTYSWLGIAGGILNLVLTILAIIGLFALFSYMENFDYSYQDQSYRTSIDL